MTIPLGPWEEGIKVNSISAINASASASHLTPGVYIVDFAPLTPFPKGWPGGMVTVSTPFTWKVTEGSNEANWIVHLCLNIVPEQCYFSIQQFAMLGIE